MGLGGRRFELALIATGLAVGAAVAWIGLAGSEPVVQPAAAVAPRPAPTLEQRAARELARSRSARVRLAPTLDRARKIAAEVEQRRTLPAGRLVLGDVTPTYVVASIELVGGSRHSRSVPADDGVHFAICAPETASCTTPAPGASRAAVREARRHGLELALHTFRETPATLVVVSVPRVAGPPTALVFERRRLLGVVVRGLAMADRIARQHLFAFAGLASDADGRDSLVARSLAPRPAGAAAADS